MFFNTKNKKIKKHLENLKNWHSACMKHCHGDNPTKYKDHVVLWFLGAQIEFMRSQKVEIDDSEIIDHLEEIGFSEEVIYKQLVRLNQGLPYDDVKFFSSAGENYTRWLDGDKFSATILQYALSLLDDRDE